MVKIWKKRKRDKKIRGTEAQLYAKRQRWKCTKYQQLSHLLNISRTTKSLCKKKKKIQIFHLHHRNHLLAISNIMSINSKELQLKTNSLPLHKSVYVPYIPLISRNEPMIFLSHRFKMCVILALSFTCHRQPSSDPLAHLFLLQLSHSSAQFSHRLSEAAYITAIISYII